MLKAYECEEGEFYAAASPEDAAMEHLDVTGDLPETGYPRGLTDIELDVEHPEFDENESPTGGVTTVRKMLAEKGDEPGWLCGSNW